MLRRRDYRPIARQRGMVLLVLAVMISVLSLGWLYARISSQRNADVVTFKTLAIARAALIGRAAADTNHPGSLPCPDTDNNGIAETTVGQMGGDCPSYIGRLPWRTLGLSDIRDANGDRLWYALSSDARDYQNLIVNSQETKGILQLNGNGNLVAVLLSPGAVIAPQVRDIGNENNVSNYLEGQNASVDNLYESRPVADAAFNDKVLTLSSAQLFRIIERGVLQQIAINLKQYVGSNQLFPFAADTSGNAQTNLLDGYVPYLTLNFVANDALAQNDWFQSLTTLPLSPYTVSATRDQVQINLKYCHGNMTRDTPMVVHCD